MSTSLQDTIALAARHEQQVGHAEQLAREIASDAHAQRADLERWKTRALTAESALRAITNKAVPNVTFADDDLISRFARDALATPGAGP